MILSDLSRLIAFFISVLEISAQLSPQLYSHNILLNNQGAYAEWRDVDGDRVEFQISAPRTRGGRFGWFGFGFSPNGGMRGADIIIGWVDEAGIPHLEDRFASDFIEPVLDERQDWTLEGSTVEEDYLVFRISRKRITCDDKDLPITTETMRLMYASSPEMPLKTADGFSLRKHEPGTTSVKSLYIFDDSDRNPSQPSAGEQITSLTFRMTDVKMTNADTVYWCEVMRFPADLGPQEMHVIGFGPSIQQGNVDLVHHILLYLCTRNINATHPRAKSFDCDKDTENVQTECQKIFGAWAKGGSAVYFPADVSFSIQGALANGGYLMMQIHYDNPSRNPTRRDNSGLEMMFTNMPRKNNAGSLRFGSGGLDWTVAIPPLQPTWTVSTECPTECLKRKLPPTGINVVMAGLHTHLLGIKVFARHIRDGREIGSITKDENYDSSYQQIKVFKEPRVLMPNDAVITECVYSSSYPVPRRNVTFGGESTREEMCLVFAFYYPAVDFVSCVSITNPSDLARQYGWTGTTTPTDNLPIKEFLYSSYNWSEQNRQKMQSFIRNGPQLYGCSGENSKDPTAFSTLPGISNFTPLVEPGPCRNPGVAARSLPLNEQPSGNQKNDGALFSNDFKRCFCFIVLSVLSLKRIFDV